MRIIGRLAILALALTACSDDDSSPPDAAPLDAAPPDAAPPDAAPTDAALPDAAPPDSSRVGLISVDEVSYFGLELEFGSGPLVQVHYTDAPRAVAPAFDDRQPDGTGCVAYQYQGMNGAVPDLPPLVDAGDVMIAGGLSPIDTCVFTDSRWGYGCIAESGSLDEGTAVGEGKGAATMEIGITTAFTPAEIRGMWVEIQGTDEPGNSGRFPVVDAFQNGPEVILVVYNNDVTYEEVPAGVSWRLLRGAGPTIENLQFLDDTTSVSVTKENGSEVEAFATAVTGAGDGFTMDTDTSAIFNDIPMTTGPLTLSCSGAGGNCGTAAFTVVRGQAADGEVNESELPVAPAAMEDGVFVDFSCVSTDPDITIPGEIMSLLSQAAPSRLQLTLSRNNSVTVTNADGANETRIMVGRGVIGTTDYVTP